jgi:hypothetical protein
MGLLYLLLLTEPSSGAPRIYKRGRVNRGRAVYWSHARFEAVGHH